MKVLSRTLILFTLFTGSALADTFSVDPTPGMADFTSPAEALASVLVSSGDTIEVAPGTYVGTVFIDKAVTLVATAGPELTTLDGASSGTVVEITAGATVEGFTITGGGGLVLIGGVAITSTETATLSGNVITENHPLGDAGIPAGGVGVGFGASAVISGNDINSNTSLSMGGLFVDAMSSVDLIGNKIHGNGGSGTITGGLLFGGSGRIVNNKITGNLGTGIGGVYIAGGIGPTPAGATVDLINNTIYGNLGSSPLGSVGGVLLDDGGMVTVVNTIVFSNMGSVGGDFFMTPDFPSPPAVGMLSLDYSIVGTPIAALLGPGMLPFGLDPLLVAPAMATTKVGPTVLGGFGTLPGSPGVGVGLDSAFPKDLPALDLAGVSRFEGGAIDIGAFEFSSPIDVSSVAPKLSPSSTLSAADSTVLAVSASAALPPGVIVGSADAP